jgi:hypothetical protein
MMQCKRKRIAQLRHLPAKAPPEAAEKVPETMHKFDAKRETLRGTEKMLRLDEQTEGHFYSIFHAPDHHSMHPSRNAVSRRGASIAFGSSARGNGIAQRFCTSADSIHPFPKNGSN